jgi:hypothetical protein
MVIPGVKKTLITNGNSKACAESNGKCSKKSTGTETKNLRHFLKTITFKVQFLKHYITISKLVGRFISSSC